MLLTSINTGKSYNVEGPIYSNELSKIWCGKTKASESKELFVKILNYGKIEDSKVANNLLEVSKEEAKTLEKVSKCTKRTPRVFDSWDDRKEKQFVIVMDMMPGCSLRQWMNKHNKETLTGKDIFVRKCIIIQICEIMRDINRKYSSFVHRDLKPENIFINFNTKTKRWDVYIIDFGCANLNHIRNVGTTNYQAPEQLGQKSFSVSITNRTDIFAIGQIFYEMLFGYAPRIGFEYQYRARENKWCQIPQPPEYLMEITGMDKLLALIEKMTSMDLRERPGYETIIPRLKN